MKRLLTALLLAITCTAHAQPTADIERVAADPLSVSALPQRLWGERVERWRWLPETTYLLGTTLVQSDNMLTTGLEAQIVERDPATRVTCSAVTAGLYALPASTQRRIVQCDKKSVYVMFFFPQADVREVR